MWTFDNLDTVMVMAYFKCGEGLQGTYECAFVVGVAHLLPVRNL